MITLVWAQSRNGVIGVDGGMPWHLPEDMAHFKAVTAGGAVVMGRRTWESLPPRFRPLPNRENIVVTRQPEWRADGALVAHSLADALERGRAAGIRIIGGGQLYAETMHLADAIEITEIDADFDGDTYAPAVPADWALASVDPGSGWHTSQTGLRYRFMRYKKAV